MPDQMQTQIDKAYQLINNAREAEALAILRPLVQQYPDSADAWWLIANADSDPASAYEALTNVTRLDPNNQDAQAQLMELKAAFPEVFGTFAAMPDAAMPDEFDALFAPASAPPLPFGATAPLSDLNGSDLNDIEADFFANPANLAPSVSSGIYNPSNAASDFGDFGDLQDFNHDFSSDINSNINNDAIDAISNSGFVPDAFDTPESVPVVPRRAGSSAENYDIDSLNMDGVLAGIKQTRSGDPYATPEPEATNNIDDLFASNVEADTLDELTKTYTAQPADNQSFDIDSLFDGSPLPAVEATQTTESTASSTTAQVGSLAEVDAMFNDDPAYRAEPIPMGAADPLAMPQPGFVEQARKRKTDRAANKTPVKAARDPKRESAVFSSVGAMQPDPLDAERRFNARNRSALPRLLIALLIIALLIGGSYFLYQNVLQPVSTATQVAGGGTIGSTFGTAAPGDFATMSQRLTTAGLGTVTAVSDSGSVMISACDKPGLALKERLFSALNIIGDELTRAATPDLKNVTFLVTDCAGGTLLYRGVAPISDIVKAVGDTTVDPRTYRTLWK